MSKDHYETYALEIGRHQGKRYANRRELKVPFDLAVGRYERLSDLQLREAIADLQEAQQRKTEEAQHRSEVAAKCGGYDPFASQFRRST